MLRRTPWRTRPSDRLRLHQDQALSTTMSLLRTLGPTGFLLEEDRRHYKVLLGDPHTCTCPDFKREQVPCKHICWVLQQKFGLAREHQYSFQHGLVESQILEVLRGPQQALAVHEVCEDPEGPPGVCRRQIQAQDVCPICQEELLGKHQPVSYCRFGCGNNVHISCMKVWVEHQKHLKREEEAQEEVRCPLCRQTFSSLKLLQEELRSSAKLFSTAERAKQDKHLGVACHSCRTSPVAGTCYRCSVCSFVYLCEDCVQGRRHPQHPLCSRSRRRDPWRQVTADLLHGQSEGEERSPHAGRVAADSLPDDVMARLLVVTVTRGSWHQAEGQQCRLCLGGFTTGQRLRILPCHHKLHVDCVDPILHRTNSCPLDGYVIYSRLACSAPRRRDKPPDIDRRELFVPGEALRGLQQNLVLAGSHRDSPGLSDRMGGLTVTTGGGPLCTLAAGQPRGGLFIGQSTPETQPRTPAGDSRTKRARTQLRRSRGTPKDQQEALYSELRMTGVLVNTHQRGGPGRTQEDPGGQERTQEGPGEQEGTQEGRGGPRRTQEDPGGQEKTQED